MKQYILLIAFCTSVGFSAEPSSHQKAAVDILDLLSGQEVFRAGFMIGLEPMIDDLRRQGSPEAMIADIKAAFTDWLEQEIIWDELKPEIAALYVQEFSEAELLEILNFYRTPTGRKAIQKLPALMQEGGKIGQIYAAGKEAALVARMEKVMAKYRPTPTQP